MHVKCDLVLQIGRYYLEIHEKIRFDTSIPFYPRTTTAAMNVSAAFVKDLEDIDGSVESISSLSAYMRMHSASAERVVAVRRTRAARARCASLSRLNIGFLGCTMRQFCFIFP